jgi:hypothetical protein
LDVLIDLTRKPLIVYPETCVTAVVVRTIGNREVNGIVCYWLDPERATRRRKELPPDAKITRGQSTLYETRLPLPGWNKAADNPYIKEEPWVPLGGRRIALTKKKDVSILPEPFEVASVYHDAVTGASGTWRAGIRIEHVEKMKKNPWVVAIMDVTTGVTLSTLAISGLDPNPLIADALPLSKAVQRTAAPGNAWTRLLEDE